MIFKKQKRVSIALLVVLAAVFLLQFTVVFADELGGYVSEQLIGMTGVDNSRLVIGSTSAENSLLDIGLVQIDDGANPWINPDSGEYQLNMLIPLVLVAMAILVLVGVLSRGEMDLGIIIVVVVFLYVLYAFLPSIQGAITAMLGGS
jgi:hypothetical protein